MEAARLVGAAAVLLSLVAAGEGLRWIGLGAEATRRLVHAGTGLAVAAVPWAFQRPAPVYLLALLFVVANGVALRRRWLPGIHGVTRRSVGTVTFPLALLPALWACWTLDPDRLFALQTAFVVLALADPAAAVVGSRRIAVRRAPAKTVAGTLAFALVALGLSATTLAVADRVGAVEADAATVLAVAAVAAVAATGAEWLARGGWDNFFVVVAVIVVLVAFHERPEVVPRLVGGLAAGAVFACAAARLRVLDPSGAVAGGLLALSVVGLGGWAWAVPAFAFFVLSSALSRWRPGAKADAEAVSEKGDVRDAGQVYANGGVGWALLLVYVVAPHPLLYVASVGAFAAAAADTWATEIGTRLGGTARLVTTGERVPPGTSGAVTLAGTLGAAAGAASVGLAAWAVAGAVLPHGGATLAAVATCAGLAASFVDSLAGATVQARYRDPATGRQTERSGRDGRAFVLVRGRRWIGNDRVNWAGTLAGALFAAACFRAVDFGFFTPL